MSYTENQPTQHNCADCGTFVPEGQARVSKRACKLVLCWRCRRKRWPQIEHGDEIPEGCALSTGATGYGLFTATLTTPGVNSGNYVRVFSGNSVRIVR